MTCPICKVHVDTTGEYVEIVIPELQRFHWACWRKIGRR